MSSIRTKDLSFSYKTSNSEAFVLKNLNIDIQKGSFVSIIGPNGSGKSTFAKLLVGLISPTGGDVFVDGLSVLDQKNLFEIRKKISFVFQNPENQIVGDTVEDDIAFGLENLGLERDEMERRITEALDVCGITDLRYRTCSKLSGGQKQREAVAAAVAMGSSCIILDEATSMLDQTGRVEVNALVHRLNKQNGTTVICITNRIEETLKSDRIVVFDHHGAESNVILDGTPKDVFSYKKQLEELGLGIPFVVNLGFELGLGAVTDAKELAEKITEGLIHEAKDPGVKQC